MRSSCWITLTGCSCPYFYGGKSWAPSETPDWLLSIIDKFEQICGLQDYQLDGINGNYYADWSQKLSWHSDDEPLFRNPENNCTIISLSLGASRPFNYKRKYASGSPFSVVLHSGDLIVMTGQMQDHYLHEVPPADTLGPRWILTFRYIYSHALSCQACTFGRPFIRIFQPPSFFLEVHKQQIFFTIFCPKHSDLRVFKY